MAGDVGRVPAITPSEPGRAGPILFPMLAIGSSKEIQTGCESINGGLNASVGGQYGEIYLCTASSGELTQTIEGLLVKFPHSKN
jgi:hypothetical protein